MTTNLLPDLSHPEVTIYQRLDNINRMNTIISNNQYAISGIRDADMVTTLFVERIRTLAMNLKIGLTPDQNADIKELTRWGYTQNIHYSSFHENLIDGYCFYGDYYDIHEHLNSVIIYFNSIVSCAAPQYKDFLRVIDTEYLSQYIKGNLYNEYKISIGNIFNLMDVLDPHRKTIDVRNYINTTTLIEGLKSNYSIDHRMVCIDQLKELIPVCTLSDFSFLIDNIFIEETRVFCMSFFIKENMVCEPNHIEFHTLREYMSRQIGDRLHQMCYVVEYLFDGNLSAHMYEQVFDMILYHNAMNQKREQPKNDLDITLVYDLTTECLLLEKDPIIGFLRGRFRQHVINGIIT